VQEPLSDPLVLVTQLLKMNRFFLSDMDFFSVCHFVYTYRCYLQTPCALADFFMSVVDFFPVCHGLHRAVVSIHVGAVGNYGIY